MSWDGDVVRTLNQFVIAHGWVGLAQFLGNTLTYAYVPVLLALWFSKVRDHRRAAFAAVIAVAIGAGLYLTTNHLFARPRPDLGVSGVTALINRLGSIDESAFPSGHATAGFAVAITLGILGIRWYGWVVGIALVNTVARIAAGVHYPTDVLAGAALGSLTATVVALKLRFIEPVIRWCSRLSDRAFGFLPHPTDPTDVPTENPPR